MTPGAEAALQVFMWTVGGLLGTIVLLITTCVGMLVARGRKAEHRLEELATTFTGQIGAMTAVLNEAVTESLDDRRALRVMLEGHNQLIIGHARELEATQKRLNNHADRLKEHGEKLIEHHGRLTTLERE